MAVRLTDSAIGKAAREAAETGQRRDLADAGCPGLRLRLTPAGARTWALACRDREGRMRRFGLGPYGDGDGQLGIAQARDQARQLHYRVRHQGADPVAERRRQRAAGAAARVGEGTLTALFDDYGAAVGSRQKHWAAARKRLEGIFRPLLKRPLSALTARDFQAAVDKHHSVASASFAVRTIRPVLKWAAKHAGGDASLAELHPPAPPSRRRRVLSEAELAALLPALRKSARPYAGAMLVMLLTLARREEVAAARWRHMDLAAGTWTIPETKNGEPHVVPLSSQAAALIRARLPKDEAGKVRKPAAENLVFSTSTGAKLLNFDRETKAIMLASGVTGWTRHDLRRTGATMLGEMGELPDVVEAALNHVSIRSPLAATYNRARYRPQVATALQRLADRLDEIGDSTQTKSAAT